MVRLSAGQAGPVAGVPAVRARHRDCPGDMRRLGGDVRGGNAQFGQVRYGMLVIPHEATFGPQGLRGRSTIGGVPQRGAGGAPGPTGQGL